MEMLFCIEQHHVFFSSEVSTQYCVFICHFILLLTRVAVSN